MGELELLHRDNATLRAQVASLTAQIGALVAELARLNERVSELLAIAQRKARKPTADKPPATPPVIGGDTRRTFDERPKAPDKPADERPAKAKPKPRGRKPIPGHLETEAHELRPDACDDCGGTALDVVDELFEEKLHVVKER